MVERLEEVEIAELTASSLPCLAEPARREAELSRHHVEPYVVHFRTW
jgi:hypothetical protein